MFDLHVYFERFDFFKELSLCLREIDAANRATGVFLIPLLVVLKKVVKLSQAPSLIRILWSNSNISGKSDLPRIRLCDVWAEVAKVHVVARHFVNVLCANTYL